jgi:hypothetical protein
MKIELENVKIRYPLQCSIQIFFITPLADKIRNIVSSLILSNLFISFRSGLHLQVFVLTCLKVVKGVFYKMINIVSRSGNLAPYMKATTQAVASQLRQLSPAVAASVKVVVPPAPELHTNYSLSNSLPSGPLHVLSGPGGTY